MKRDKEKKQYEAPQLTVVSFKAERGYATSTLTRSVWIGAWVSGISDPSALRGLNDYEVHDTPLEWN